VAVIQVKFSDNKISLQVLNNHFTTVIISEVDQGFFLRILWLG